MRRDFYYAVPTQVLVDYRYNEVIAGIVYQTTFIAADTGEAFDITDCDILKEYEWVDVSNEIQDGNVERDIK